MQVFVIIVLTMFGVLLDLSCGNLGIVTGFTLANAVYFCGAYGRRAAWISVVAGGVIIDSVYGRPFPASAVIYVTALLAASAVIRKKNDSPLLDAGVAGLIIGAVGSLGSIITGFMFRMPLPGPDWWSIMIFHTLGMGGFMLLLTLALDFLAVKAKLPGFGHDGKGGARSAEVGGGKI